MTNKTSLIIQEYAPLILAEIQKAKSILLHCHPSPDPDSVCSALAMRFVLEQLGKKVTVIKGDSDIPDAFMHFPGTNSIVQKNFFEVDLKNFDLFISLDTADLKRISSRGEVIFPNHLTVVDIDHHVTNTQFGSINLIESEYPATCQILFDLFEAWNIKITPEIASNLFMGIYTDTGGFKYRGVTTRTFEIIAQLSIFIPSIPEIISRMENSNTPAILHYYAAALNSIELSDTGKFAYACVSLDTLTANKIPMLDIRASEMSSFLLTVAEWEVVASAVEFEPNKIKFSFRSRDMNKYDVSKIAVALGGGGHKMAAGVTMNMSFDEAKKLVMSKVKELYDL